MNDLTALLATAESDGISEILRAVLIGEIPKALEYKRRALFRLKEFERLAPSASAILLVTARKDNFNDDPGTWKKWVLENFGFEESYMYKLLHNGETLLHFKGEKEVFEQLVRLGVDKLLPLKDLDRNTVAGFLKDNYPIDQMTRDQVRAAVDKALGRVPADGGGSSGGGGMVQPDLFGALDTIIDCDPKAVAAADGFDEISARKFATSGVGLLEASLNYWSERAIPDLQVITMIEGELIEAQHKFALLRKGLTESAMNAG